MKTLAEYGLKLIDISAMTTDAAAVMRKLGESIKEAVAPRPFFHQLCFAHGVHLAVLDAFKSTSEYWPPSGEWQLVGIDEEEIEEVFEGT